MSEMHPSIRSAGEPLDLPLDLPLAYQVALALYGFEIIGATRYFDDTIIVAKQPHRPQEALLTLSDKPEVWAAEFRYFTKRYEP